MTSAPDPLDEFRRTEPAADSLAVHAQSLEAVADTVKRKDRSAIGRWVVAVFLAVVAILILYVLVAPIFSGWDSVKATVEHATALVSSILLPVVTLVLGLLLRHRRQTTLSV